MTQVAVDPAEFAGAGAQVAQVSELAGTALSGLVGALEASSGMGGSDQAGVSWAHGYDDGARGAVQALAMIASGAGQVSTLLHATGANHAAADAASTIGGGDGQLPPAPVPPGAPTPSLPSAAGGSGGGPPGWSLIAHLVGYAWPNGHQDRLRAAQTVWFAAARGVDAAAGPVGGAVCRIDAQQTPEAPAASAATNQLEMHLGEVSAMCAELGRSCGEYAGHIDHAHHEILSIIKDLIVQTAAIEAGGAVLAFFTAGLDEAAAQAAVAARIASAAAKVRRVIEALIQAARVVGDALLKFGGRAGEIIAKLKPLLEAGVKRAETVAVKGAAKWDKFSSTREYEFNAVHNPGPLAEGVDPQAATFAGGRYNSEVLKNDTVLYRCGSDDRPLGQYFVREPPESSAQVRIDSAVKPIWTDTAGQYTGRSSFDRVWAVEFPEGTKIYSGPTGAQGDVYVGGPEQIHIPKPWTLEHRVVGSWPIS